MLPFNSHPDERWKEDPSLYHMFSSKEEPLLCTADPQEHTISFLNNNGWESYLTLELHHRNFIKWENDAKSHTEGSIIYVDFEKGM